MTDRPNPPHLTRSGDLSINQEPSDLLRGQREDSSVEKTLRNWVTAGIVLALLLTGFMGFMSVRSAERAANVADWISHTRAVETKLEATLKHAMDVETGARGFAATGEESFLDLYQEGQRVAREDMNSLRQLTADNPAQQRRLDLLESQVNARIEVSKEMVGERRRTGTIPPTTLFLEGLRRMGAVRNTVAEMQAEEDQLLKQRTERTRGARRSQNVITIASTVVGVIVLLIAGFAIGREINKSAHMRGQLKALNVDLEQRVAQRTAALETQSLMLQSVLDSMAEGLVAVDEGGKFLIWNRAAERIVGYGPTDLPTEEWSAHYGNYLPDGVTPMATEQLPVIRAMRGEASTSEIFLRNPKITGGAWIEASGNPLKDKDGVVRGGVVAFRDITRRKADEREIRSLNNELEERVIRRTAQLEETNKELEAFTYSVSHDLRAPLRHMAGFSGLLLEEFGPTLDAQAQHYARRIQVGTREMGQLVDELLSLARVGRQSANLQITGLNSMVKEVIAILEPEWNGRHVEWKIADLPSVECDPILMKQVFQNLFSNALKYSRPRLQAVIEVGRTDANGQAVIFVRDNGVGFNMKYSDKLFGVFQRLHRTEEFEGTGVGLATVHRIIKKHGGRVWAEAELDKGATFYFTVDLAAPVEQKGISATAGTGV